MYIGKKAITISRSRARVYSVATTYPKFVSFFLNGSRVLLEDDVKLLVEVHNRLVGLRISWQGEGVKSQNRCIQFTQTKGLFKGLRARWSFVSKPDGQTKVTICTSFQKPLFTPVGEMILGRFLVECVTEKILRELKRKAEYSNP